ncbi:hypothetical protein DAPPUDRAFT_258772 [Daphnia pulex]|uniref:Uncharacterized protein n=1 Tax=Daphnia pulex TaxID=6669 RepID=E9HG17_DAPPU|nr:hypothetical protein DAPPUDRAFT_258772 [Daphnia pulex]|eukprot:EFX69337.1 hypothetical protein DAPPUDRAFT_258772 [Daphnia pulex]
MDCYTCTKCLSTHFSWCNIYEKHLKYREASDDESSDKEDVPPDVESSQGESDSSGDLSSGNDTRDDSGESEGPTLEANLEANSDEDSDLSSAFSDYSLDEDDDDFLSFQVSHFITTFFDLNALAGAREEATFEPHSTHQNYF